MMYNTCKCQEIFRTRFTGSSGVPFQDFRSGKAIRLMTVDLADLTRYRSEKNRDMGTFYYKSVLSFAEGLACVSRKNYTWATIKLYYSTYFGLRSLLLSRNHVLVRANRNLYYFEIKPGAIFLPLTDNTDHGGTIEVYSKIFGSSDFMCIDEIDGKPLLLWLKNCREVVNYKDEEFHDPDVSEYWEYIDQKLEHTSIHTVVDEFTNRKKDSCTSIDTAILAISVNRILSTAQEIRNNGVEVMSDEQKWWIRSILDGLVDKSFLEKIIV